MGRSINGKLQGTVGGGGGDTSGRPSVSDPLTSDTEWTVSGTGTTPPCTVAVAGGSLRLDAPDAANPQPLSAIRALPLVEGRTPTACRVRARLVDAHASSPDGAGCVVVFAAQVGVGGSWYGLYRPSTPGASAQGSGWSGAGWATPAWECPADGTTWVELELSPGVGLWLRTGLGDGTTPPTEWTTRGFYATTDVLTHLRFTLQDTGFTHATDKYVEWDSLTVEAL